MKKRQEKRERRLFSERARGSLKKQVIRRMLRIRRFSGGCGLRKTSSENRSGNSDQEAKEVPIVRLSHPEGIKNIIRLCFR
jgi:hypothetical protein